jgi:hypothetical protein
MALLGPAHGQRGVHVHVVAREVEGDQTLEEDGPAGEGGRQENQQTRRGAAVRDHVQDGAEARRLLEVARGIAVQRIQQARDAVQERAGARVQRHVVERGDGEDDARVAWRVKERASAMAAQNCAAMRPSGAPNSEEAYR